MINFDEFENKVFGKLKVIEYEIRNGHVYFKCQCSCGNQNYKYVRKDHLLNEDVQSCGCLYKERTHSKVDKPTYDFVDDIVIGTTFDGKQFIFDKDDYTKVSPYCWYFDAYGYVVARIGKKAAKLHRFLLDFPKSKVDHINRKRNDCRKCNLREISDTFNAVNRSKTTYNTSGIVGVYYRKNQNDWTARIKVNKQELFLGSFMDKEDAIKARLLAEQEHFGEYAPQKHLFDQYLAPKSNKLSRYITN